LHPSSVRTLLAPNAVRLASPPLDEQRSFFCSALQIQRTCATNASRRTSSTISVLRGGLGLATPSPPPLPPLGNFPEPGLPHVPFLDGPKALYEARLFPRAIRLLNPVPAPDPYVAAHFFTQGSPGVLRILPFLLGDRRFFWFGGP